MFENLPKKSNLNFYAKIFIFTVFVASFSNMYYMYMNFGAKIWNYLKLQNETFVVIFKHCVNL